MRQIKYKAFDKKTKKIADVLVIDWLNGVVGLTFGRIERDLSEVKLMQYTNQKNHEGKEIYEGYYVSKEMGNGFDYGEFEGVVELIDGKWVINNRINHYEELFTELEQIEILGNIFENPELLGAQNG